MRVALLNSLFPDLGIGGSEMSTFYLARGLQSLGHTVRVFSQNSAEQDVSETYKGIDVFRCGNPPGYGPNILAAPRLERKYVAAPVGPAKFSERIGPLFTEFRPDVVHTNVVADVINIWELAAQQHMPVVHTLRSYSLLCHRRMLKGNVPCTRQCLSCLTENRHRARRRSNSISGLVAISNHVMDVHRTSGWFSNVANRAVIANSYEAAKTADWPDERSSLYDFGYIGRIHETKGVDVFLDALSNLDTSPRVLVAGDGNPGYIAQLRRRYRRPNIVFGGYMQQDQFFSQVKYCVVPSVWFEPFGRVFIESLHHGVPVIGSRRGGGAEVLDDKTGWLFDPGNVQELVSVLGIAMTRPIADYRSMSAACLAKAQEYSVTSIAQAYIDFYNGCLEARS